MEKGPISERLAAARYNRSVKKQHRQGERESKSIERESNRKKRWAKNHPGKFVSTSSTVASVGQKYKPGEKIEQTRKTDGGGTQTNKHTVSKSIKDSTGAEFNYPDEVTTTTTNKGQGETITGPEVIKDDFNQGKEMYDNNKKWMGDRIHEVYKINDTTPDKAGGKFLDKVRSSTISHGAQSYNAHTMGGSDEVLSTTRTDKGKTMTQEKVKKSGVTKTKKYVSRNQLGGSISFDPQNLDASGNPRAIKGSQKDVTKKDWKKEGYKVISDKRMERKHERFGNYKHKKTIVGGRSVAGGTKSKSMLMGYNDDFNDKSQLDSSMINLANRLFTGDEKGIDSSRVTKEMLKRERKGAKASKRYNRKHRT